MEFVAGDAVFRGELRRIMLALGVVLVVMVAAWAIEEWRQRGSPAPIDGFGIGCLAITGLLAVALIFLGWAP